MRARVWVAMIDWIDGGVEDTDELRVRACCANEAERIARAIWSAKTGQRYPHCSITKVSCTLPHEVGVL